ncbi:hypothetical protein JCM8547_004436 [Rhodosporidiobolus lusitaniae]
MARYDGSSSDSDDAHPSTFDLPRRRRKRRREVDGSTSGSEDSSASSSDDDDRGRRRRAAYAAAAPPPMCTTNQLVLSVVVLVTLLSTGTWLIYQHGGLSSLFSSPSSPDALASTADASSPPSSSKSTASKSSTTADSSSTFAASTGKSTTATSSSSAASSSSFSTSGGSGSGLFGVTDPTCGDSGAVDEPVAGGGPNGAQSWLNCGLSKEEPDGKWTPPHIELSQLKSVALSDALQLDIFSACRSYSSAFESASSTHSIPAILLVAIAMTESSCNPDAKGDNGDAWGLMQILSDKCDGAPGGDCADPEFNVGRGAEYFNTVLEEFGGSTLLALGQYNGWYEGLTYNKATEIGKDQSTCVYQNNLDYMETVLNGYMQGVDGQQLATVKNLEICNDDRR